VILLTVIIQLPEHIKNYYKTWKEVRNEKNSIEQHRAAYDLFCKLIKPNLALVPRVPVADRMTLEQQIKPAHQESHNNDRNFPTSWEISNLLCLQSGQTTMTIFKYVDPSKLISAATTSGSQSKAESSRKWPRPETDHNDQEAEPSTKRHHAPRTCLKCRRTDCPGRWKVDKCTVSIGLFLVSVLIPYFQASCSMS
jgi:hypothetical protein